MRIVEDEAGTPLVVRKESEQSLLVADPETGAKRYVDRDAVTPRTDDAALTVAASAVAPATRRVLTAVPDERTLGLLLELADRGPLAVRDLLADYDLCESDLHGRLAEFRAAGLVTETTVAGERGYDATDLARDGLEDLRSPPADD